MKAWLCKHYGSPDLLEMAELDDPVAGCNEMVVRVVAASVSIADARVRELSAPCATW